MIYSFRLRICVLELSKPEKLIFYFWFAVNERISLPRLVLHLQVQHHTISCNKPAVPGRVSFPQRKRRNIFCNHAARCNQGIFTNYQAGKDCSIGADACAFLWTRISTNYF